MMIDALKGHSKILLDSCIWIYYLENHPCYADTIEQLLKQCASKEVLLFSSELSLLEIKAGPLRFGREEVAGEYQLYLDEFPYLTMHPINRLILNRAIRLRVQYGLKTPDAIILATGLETGATLVVTNDQQFKKVEGIDVICLSDLDCCKEKGT